MTVHSLALEIETNSGSKSCPTCLFVDSHDVLRRWVWKRVRRVLVMMMMMLLLPSTKRNKSGRIDGLLP